MFPVIWIGFCSPEKARHALTGLLPAKDAGPSSFLGIDCSECVPDLPAVQDAANHSLKVPTLNQTPRYLPQLRGQQSVKRLAGIKVTGPARIVSATIPDHAGVSIFAKSTSVHLSVSCVCVVRLVPVAGSKVLGAPPPADGVIFMRGTRRPTLVQVTPVTLWESRGPPGRGWDKI